MNINQLKRSANTRLLTPSALKSILGSAIWRLFDSFESSTVIRDENNKVSQWTDLKNGGNAVQGSAGAQPTYDPAKKCITFATGQSLDMTTSSADLFRNKGQASIIACLKYPDTAARVAFIVGSGASVAASRALICNNVVLFTGLLEVGGRRLDADSAQAVSGGAHSSKKVVQTGKWDWTNSDLYSYKNGVLVNTKTDFQTSGSTSDTNSLQVRIGANNGSNYFAGDFYGLVIGYFSAQQRLLIEQWMINRYGVSL